MRVITFKGDIVNADFFERTQAVRVIKVTTVDVLFEQLARWNQNFVGDAAPTTILFPHIVGTFEDVRDPTDLAFAVRNFEIGKFGEDTTHEPVNHAEAAVREREC